MGRIRDYFGKSYHDTSDRTVYSDRILTIPNLLTISRLFGLPFLLLFIFKIDELGPIPALILGSYMIISDSLDGILAKALNQVSLVGAIMDPVVDKITINAVAVSLAFHGCLPFWAVIVLALRDIGILVFGLRIFINHGILVTPIIWARASALFWGGTLIAAIAHMELVKWILLPIAVVLTIITGIVYCRRYKDLLKMKSRG